MLKGVKRSLLIATAGVILFIIAHTFYNYDIVRKYVEDSAFDYFSTNFLASKPQKANAPNCFVFGVDEHYLDSKGLLNKEGRTNYGYIFPRGLIAQFIINLDAKVASLKDKPKALFVDYDLSFSSLPYGKELSDEDKKLLAVLKHPREYPIILPKTMQHNIFEKHLAKEIAKGSILFRSVGFLSDSDGYARRYQPIKHDSPHVALVLYRLSGRDIDYSAFEAIEVVENKIIIKNNQNSNNYITQSYWEELKFISLANFDHILNDALSDAIIMFGATHQESMDHFESKNGKVSGIALHGHTLMTLFWLEGKLKQLDIVPAIIIVFLAAFLVELMVERLSNRYNIQSLGTEFLLLVSILAIVMLSLSYFIFIYFHLWFNWFIPLVVLQVHKVLDILKQIFQFTKIDYGDRLRLFLRFGFK